MAHLRASHRIPDPQWRPEGAPLKNAICRVGKRIGDFKWALSEFISKKRLQKGQLQAQVLLTAKIQWYQCPSYIPTSTHGQPHYYPQVRSLSNDTRAAQDQCAQSLSPWADNHRKSSGAAGNQAKAPSIWRPPKPPNLCRHWESGRVTPGKLVANTIMPGTILEQSRKQIFQPRPSNRLHLATGFADIKATWKSKNWSHNMVWNCSCCIICAN